MRLDRNCFQNFYDAANKQSIPALYIFVVFLMSSTIFTRKALHNETPNAHRGSVDATVRRHLAPTDNPGCVSISPLCCLKCPLFLGDGGNKRQERRENGVTDNTRSGSIRVFSERNQNRQAFGWSCRVLTNTQVPPRRCSIREISHL